jgi:hypothetical protein
MLFISNTTKQGPQFMDRFRSSRILFGDVEDERRMGLTTYATYICIYVYMYMICLCICICICIYYVFIMYLDISFTFCLFSPIHWWSLVLVQWKFRQVASHGRRVSTTTPQMSVEPKKIIIAQDKSAQSPIDSQCSIYDFHSAF